MKKADRQLIYSALIAVFILVSCNSRLPYRNLTKSTTYNEQSKFMMPFTAAYHVNDSTSRIFLSLTSSSLLYAKKPNGTTFYAQYRINYDVYPFDAPNAIQDSGHFVYTDSLYYQKTAALVDSFDIHDLSKKIYAVNLSLSDLNKNTTVKTQLILMRDDAFNRQNFRLYAANNSTVINQIRQAGQGISVSYNNKNCFRLFVRCYKSDYPIALPPFVENREPTYSLKPDSTFILDLSDGESPLFQCKRNSIFHIQADTTQKEGITLLTFYDGFPAVTTAEQMLAPVRYISTKNEFNDLKMMKSAKQAVDEFWLEKAGTVERAKDMILRYYNRVQDANKYFTSYLEGWKSDRGMIYIVFGPPNAMYRSATQETWIYGEDRNMLSTTFTFNKVENPFSDNDYSLERSAEYKDTWYTAVETWRK